MPARRGPGRPGAPAGRGGPSPGSRGSAGGAGPCSRRWRTRTRGPGRAARSSRTGYPTCPCCSPRIRTTWAARRAGQQPALLRGRQPHLEVLLLVLVLQAVRGGQQVVQRAVQLGRRSWSRSGASATGMTEVSTPRLAVHHPQPRSRQTWRAGARCAGRRATSRRGQAAASISEHPGAAGLAGRRRRRRPAWSAARRTGRLGHDARPGQEGAEALVAADPAGPLELLERPAHRDQADARRWPPARRRSAACRRGPGRARRPAARRSRHLLVAQPLDAGHARGWRPGGPARPGAARIEDHSDITPSRPRRLESAANASCGRRSA